MIEAALRDVVVPTRGARLPGSLAQPEFRGCFTSTLCWIERLLDPSLRSNPIAVGGGVVLAASYEAREPSASAAADAIEA